MTTTATTDRIYVETTPTNCIVGGEHGQVTGIVRDLGLRRTPRAAFVRLDCGDMLYVTLGNSSGDRAQWHKVITSRRITRDEFDHLTEIDTLRRDMGWRP